MDSIYNTIFKQLEPHIQDICTVNRAKEYR